MNASTKARLRRLNTNLTQLTRNAYFDSPCPNILARCIEEVGFNTDALDGIYTGADGRIHEDIGEGVFLTLTWHKMEVTGRFEVVAYAN